MADPFGRRSAAQYPRGRPGPLGRVGRTVAGFNFTNLGEELPQAPDVVLAVVARLVELERT